MIVVTGATGNVGRPLVEALAAAGEQVTAVSRKKAEVPAGVHFRQADLIIPESIEDTLRGADSLFLLTAADFLAAGDIDAVVEVVRRAGVRRVVLLSSQGVGTERHSPHLEHAIRQSGLEWTVLQPGNFDSNALQWAHGVRTRREVTAPFGDIGLPAVDPADIAAVAALALSEPGHEGNTYTLTGPVAITPRQQAATIAHVLGEPVRFTELSRDRAREEMSQYMPAPVVEATLGVLGTPTEAEQRVSPDIERLLGRPPHTFADWAERNIAAFR
ncbi:NAD(P)H-binding protein [Nocardia sp. NPDC004568]|uniref:NAD(P)H-binding protein n=1 Tax=Nocardia sp. NPDC004568 TaxID=3154551 RepID=UPI0033BA41AD